jgi:hypothetical protein
MRRIVYITALLLFITSLVLCMPAMAGSHMIYAPEPQDRLLDFCNSDKGIYILSQKSLLMYQEDSSLVEKLADNSLDLSCLSWDGSTLLAASKQGDVYQWDALQKKLVFLNKIHLEELQSFFVTNITHVGEKVYCIVHRSQDWVAQLVFSDISQDTWYLIDNIVPSMIKATKNDKVFVLIEENTKSNIYILDIEKLSLSLYYECTFSNVLNFECIDDTVYLSTYNGMYKEIEPVNGLNFIIDFAVIDEYILYALGYDGVYKCDLSPGNEELKLSIAGISTRYDNTFMAQSGIAVQNIDFSISNLTTMQYISQAIATQDDKVDLFIFPARDGLKFLKEKGMYVDLGNSELLSRNASLLYPRINQALFYKNMLMAWPISVDAIVGVDSTVTDLERRGFTYPRSFDDFLDVCHELYKSGIADEQDYRLIDTVIYQQQDMIEYFVKLYLFEQQLSGNQIHFDTPTFRRIIQQILNEVPREDKRLYTGEENVIFAMSNVFSIINDKMIPPLYIEERDHTAVEADMWVAVINPYSKNIQNAILYLEYISSRKDAYSYSYYMQPPYESLEQANKIEDLKSQLLKLKEKQVDASQEKDHLQTIADLETEIEYLKSNRFLVSESAIRNYEKLAANFVILEDTPLYFDNTLLTLVKQLVGGVISLNDFVQACDNKAAMVYGE